ncbi:unnamed protein product [Menidia menidia]|uniref:(Atlantic silverside) hypothetical protein n=1 Tax=Menidia menidia TaxID=238744 RepID=A0A8S4BAH6_9TELE|nr:unnamed protein product [Menidia menidia]
MLSCCVAGAGMDETEKYKQRLEAIAEKRRLQDEQDKARREKEDEKLRLEQLKRKSLRDKWLMEGAPSSPTSPSAETPHSPLLSTQAQDMEKDTDKLESENQQLGEKKKNLKDGQKDTEDVVEAGAENAQDVVQNGPNDTRNSVALTNSDQHQPNSNHIAPDQSESDTNGPIGGTESGDCKSPGAENDAIEGGSGQIPNADNDEEEEGTLVMRAECVIITDEGDDVSVELTTQEASENLTEAENSDASECATKKMQDMDEGQDEKIEVQGRATVALVPVYTEVPSSALSSALEAEEEKSTAAEAALKVANDTRLSGQFQEVPLTDPRNSLRTEAGPAEQEPLLSKAETPKATAELAGANSRGSAEPQSPTRGNPGGNLDSPKHKNCQCCSVM